MFSHSFIRFVHDGLDSSLPVELKMAVHRFQMASNKKSALLKQNMREVAVLLAEDPPREEKARIRAESLIRDDYMIEAYDILSLNCELLSERIKLIQHTKECPPDLVSCISTLIYAAPRVDIPELITIRQQFKSKYGKEFDENAMNNVGGVLNERVVSKLSVQPPAAFLVQTYLETICERFEVEWSPTLRLSAKDMVEPMKPPDGYSVQIAQGTGLGQQVGIQAHTGMTVNGDDDSAYGGGDALPPRAPGVFKPSTGGSIGGQSAKDEPEIFVPDDFARPDVFVPKAPGQSQTSSVTGTQGPPPPTKPSAPPPGSVATGNKNDVDDDDEDDNDNNASTGGQSKSYRDLAARFENLKNL
jgi:Regulator of Vps4 activity in the MVB pathway